LLLIIKIQITLLLLITTLVNTCNGQLLTALNRKEDAVYLTTGLYKNAPLLSLGLAKCLHFKVRKVYDEHLTLFVDFTSKSNFHSNENYKYSYGAQGYIVKKGNFKLLLRKTFTLTRVVTTTDKGSYLGGELELLPGIYTEKYFIAAHFYYGDSFRGHVAQRGHVASDIETGWVKPHMGVFMTGINGGYYFRKNLCLYFDIDFYVIRPKHSIVSFPLVSEYAGVNYIF
jgi:hypothetical protein